MFEERKRVQEKTARVRGQDSVILLGRCKYVDCATGEIRPFPHRPTTTVRTRALGSEAKGKVEGILD